LTGAIVLDLRLARREEGGPGFRRRWRFVSACRPSGHAPGHCHSDPTIERIVPTAAQGRPHCARVALVVALQAVAVPDALRENPRQSSGFDGHVGRWKTALRQKREL